MEKKQGTKWKKGLLWAVMILALCGAAFGIYVLVFTQQETAENREAAEALRDAVIGTPAPVATADPVQTAQPAKQMPTATSTPVPTPEMWYNAFAQEPDKEIDFSALQAINPDICAWITVPGTEIDYPVAYAPKLEGYYLSHDIEGNNSRHGAIFMDDYNMRDFSDPVTFIYGHNMKDGSMFAGLHSFEDAMFFDAHAAIHIYTPEHMFVYEIVAAYKTGDENIIALHDFTDPEVLREYQEEMFAVRDMNANYRDAELTVDDRLLVLATCVSGDDDARYLVHGRLKANG